jgi:hypothetical protein
VGTIAAYVGTSPPAGWTVCDGKWLSIQSYAALYAVLGSSYAVDGTSFHVPDLRGQFLRDADAGRVAGSWQDWSTGMPRSGPWTTSGVNLAHHHGYQDAYYSEKWGNGADGNLIGGASSDTDNRKYEDLRYTDDQLGWHAHEVYGGDAETRPVNVAVNWIIKMVD